MNPNPVTLFNASLEMSVLSNEITFRRWNLCTVFIAGPRYPTGANFAPPVAAISPRPSLARHQTRINPAFSLQM